MVAGHPEQVPGTRHGSLPQQADATGGHLGGRLRRLGIHRLFPDDVSLHHMHDFPGAAALPGQFDGGTGDAGRV